MQQGSASTCWLRSHKCGRCVPVAGQLLPPLQLPAPFGHVAVLRAQPRHRHLEVQPLLDDAEPHAVELDGVSRSAAQVLGVGALESILDHRGASVDDPATTTRIATGEGYAVVGM